MSARGTAGGTAGEGGLNVAATFARGLRFLTQPVGGVTGLLLTTQPVVQVLNDSGNVDQNYSGPVTISLQGVGVLSGTTTVNAVTGVANFTNLTIVGVGTANLVATVPGIGQIVSDTVTTLLTAVGGLLGKYWHPRLKSQTARCPS